MDDNELIILSHLRNNARKSLVEVAREARIPISTVYDKVRRYEQGLIKKSTCIIDFQKLGYNIRLMLFAKVRDEEKFRSMAEDNRHMNSVFRLNDRGSYLADCIFMHMAELEDFLQELEGCGAEEKSMHFVSEEVVRENFISGAAHQAKSDAKGDAIGTKKPGTGKSQGG
ncbi:MAG: hypothetical protein R6U32_01335 [Candidatus Woesearchaeota archaeon]